MLQLSDTHQADESLVKYASKESCQLELNRKFVSCDNAMQGIGERNSLWLLKEAAPLKLRYESLLFAKPLLLTLELNLLKRENKCEALIYFGVIPGLVVRDNFCHLTRKGVTVG